ncbi:MAG: RNA polymerase subunit sigma-70, partial [Nitratireductor sp.]|nr:RNA polymerase subunit sigma-70 [Nitratireductor sp.]
RGAASALANLAAIASTLQDYQPFHAARADILARAGDVREALAAYDHAIALSRNRPDRLFLENRKRKLQAG